MSNQAERAAELQQIFFEFAHPFAYGEPNDRAIAIVGSVLLDSTSTVWLGSRDSTDAQRAITAWRCATGLILSNT